MSLRKRVFIGCIALGIVLGLSVAVLAHRQRAFMTVQLDAQLRSSESFAEAVALLVVDPEALGLSRAAAAATTGFSFTEVSFAYVAADGTVVQPRSLAMDDRPDLRDLDVDTLDPDESTIRTFSSDDGGRAFRVILTPVSSGGFVAIALPLDDVERTVEQLLLTSLMSSALVLAVFALIAWSVERIGLRPILRMTRDADAITSGERDRRVEEHDPATEVGRLGRAFNRVLDERDVAEERLRRFVADASHELRTPITSLRGYLDLSIDGNLDDTDAEQVMGRMRREARRMNDLVEDLLLLANIDSGRPLRSEPVDLSLAVRDAAADAAMLQPARPIEVIAPERAVVVIGDQVRIEQVLTGLVGNALVHTPPSAAIRLSVRPRGDDVEVVVADEGPGIDPTIADRVFDRFVRGDQSRSRHGGSTGLGLSIAKSVIEALGGRLELTNDPGSGCAFVVVLPVASEARADGRSIDMVPDAAGQPTATHG